MKTKLFLFLTSTCVLWVLLLNPAARAADTDATNTPPATIAATPAAKPAASDADRLAAWRLSAERGDAFSQSYLGDSYSEGFLSLKKDMTEAAKWYHKAADQGYASAQYSLGSCYENGEGVNKDLSEAVTWYRKAAAQGYAPAKSSIARLEKNSQIPAASEPTTPSYNETIDWLKRKYDGSPYDEQGFVVGADNEVRTIVTRLTQTVKECSNGRIVLCVTWNGIRCNGVTTRSFDLSAVDSVSAKKEIYTGKYYNYRVRIHTLGPKIAIAETTSCPGEPNEYQSHTSDSEAVFESSDEETAEKVAKAFNHLIKLAPKDLF